MTAPASASRVRVGLAQLDCVPGDVAANLATCLAAAEEARADGADVVVLPELALTGMPVERRSTAAAVRLGSPALDAVRERSHDISIALGFLEDGGDGRIHNVVGYFEGGELLHVHRKVYPTGYGLLPDERGVVTAGEAIASFATRFGRLAMLICEDAWHVALPYLAVMGGAELLLTCAGSPRGNTSQSCTSADLWATVNRAHAVTLKAINVFVNRVGSAGPLKFWGGSHAVGPDGRLLARLDHDSPGVAVVELDLDEVARERRAYPYVADERPEVTLRGLQSVVAAGASRRDALTS